MLTLVTLTVFWPFLVYFFGLFGVLFWDGSQGGDFEGLGGSWGGDFEGMGGIPKVEEGPPAARLQSGLQEKGHPKIGNPYSGLATFCPPGK